MNISLEVKADCNVPMNEFSDAFAKLDNESQAHILNDMFDSLLHTCKSKEKFDMQLSYISDYIKKQNMRHLIQTIETLNWFLNEGEN